MGLYSKEEGLHFLEHKELKVNEATLTGKEILEHAGYNPAPYDLYLVRGKKREYIQPDQVVTMENGLLFNAIFRTVYRFYA